MTRQRKYELITIPLLLAAPVLAYVFREQSEMIAVVALIVMAVIVVFYLRGLPPQQRKKRIVWGIVCAVFIVTVQIFHSYIFEQIKSLR